MTPGPLIILSGPSGVGKSTVIRRLLTEGGPPMRLSVSATTRTRREGERDGVDYTFWSPERFQQEIDAGGFLEWAEVHGRRYGTLRSEVERWLAQGCGILLDIDVHGAEQVRRKCPHALSIFLKLPSWEMYECVCANGTPRMKRPSRAASSPRGTSWNAPANTIFR